MPYKGDPIAEKLDKLAEATGMPQLSRRLANRYPVRFRIVPLILLAVAFGGLWAQIAVSEIYGYFVVMFAFLGTMALLPFSPLKKVGRGFDEREAALVKSGHFIGLLVAAGLVVLGCVFIGLGVVASKLGLGHFWAPSRVTDWFALALLLATVEINVAILAASARLPSDDPNDEDE
ncbi:hypothetical protein KK137_15760 [Croceibacterium sp. LX-88]|uniref:Uncharacterized protein n=1 Tax=Croceibacterium selenioxidans TaxID=2838833 RepID=A0ABS5W814_9SPHN|nr:hypothetical protein [Croceibacterium selenioxidans]MBT2135794.1 hypothetical protein [Croceibacterium selenioxidans]